MPGLLLGRVIIAAMPHMLFSVPHTLFSVFAMPHTQFSVFSVPHTLFSVFSVPHTLCDPGAVTQGVP
jgi:hypothetical protein